MSKWIGLAVLFAGCADGGEEMTRAETILSLTGDATAGESLFGSNCVACHEADGSGNASANNVDIRTSTEQVIVDSIVTAPVDVMVGFQSVLTDQNVADITAYVITL